MRIRPTHAPEQRGGETTLKQDWQDDVPCLLLHVCKDFQILDLALLARQTFELDSAPDQANFLDFVHLDDRAQFCENFALASRLRVRLKVQNDWLWHEVRWKMVDENRFVVSAFDVHQQVLAEKFIAAERAESYRNLNRQASELQKAQQIKSQLMANMSHELRTPLTAILGLSEALEVGLYGECSEEQVEAFRTIHESGKSLLALINDILDVTKLETSDLELQLEHLSIKEVVNSVLRLYKTAAQRKNVTIAVNIDNENEVFSGDRKRLKQILSNLIGNAVKFTRESTEVECQIVHAQHNLFIDVSDRGPGISAEGLETIFQPFRQLDEGLSRRFGGLGLGLSLVQKLIHFLGGSLSVNNRDGGGSHFCVELPLHRVEAVKPAGLVPELTGSGSVLVVDDHEASSRFLCDALVSWGFIAYSYSSLAELCRSHVDDVTLVLMGGLLGDGGGVEGIRWLRKQDLYAKVPIILLTASDGNELKRQGLQAGAQAYLEKPIELSNLSRCISVLLQGEHK